MFIPDLAIKIGTNRYKGDLIFNTLAAGQALTLAGIYAAGFHRTGLMSIPSVLSGMALVAGEFAALHGISCLYKQGKIHYTTAIILAEIAYLLPKIVAVATLVFSQIMPFSTAILAVGLLIPGIMRAGNDALDKLRFCENIKQRLGI